MKKTNHEILNFRNYMKSILELQNNYHNEEIQVIINLNSQI